ncbi:MAG: PEP-CTERM sorting domain-containing protein [Limnoraphis robusta]
MKTKLFALLTGLTTVTTLVAATVPAQAGEIDDLIQAFREFAPTQDRMQIQADGVNLKEFALTGPLTLGQSTGNLEAVFLGEVAGNLDNKLDFSSSNGQSGTMWSDIKAFNELYDYGTTKSDGITHPKMGSFNPEYNSLDGFLDIGSKLSLGSFAAGDSLDFMLSNSNANFGLASGQFKGYSLEGFEDWLIVGVEDKILANSDRDFNDVVFAVKLGSPAASVPEPSTIAALMGVGAAFGVSRRKNANKS